MSTSNEIALRRMPPNTFDDEAMMVQISVLGNKLLPEPMLTQICVTIWCHWGMIGYLWNVINYLYPGFKDN